MEEIRPYIQGETREDIDAAMQAALYASHGDLVDAYESNRLWGINMLNRLHPTMKKRPVTIVDMKRDGDGSLRVVWQYKQDGKYGSGKFTSNMPLDFKNDDGIQYTGFQIMQLFSDREFVNEGKFGYHEVAVDMLNNPDSMVEFASEIAAIDGANISADYKSTLIQAISNIAQNLKQFMPKVAIHLNTEVQRTGGWIEYEADKADVFIGIGADKSKSALEVYAHEMYHAVTAMALDMNDAQSANTRREIMRIKNLFLDKVSVAEFGKLLDGGEQEATKILDYFADPDVGIKEFVAYSMTNKGTIEALKTLKLERDVEEHPDWASKLVAIVREWFSRLEGYFDKELRGDVHNRMQTLVNRLAEANNRQLEIKRNTAMERIFDTLVKLDTKVAKYIKDAERKVEKSPLPQMKSYSTVDQLWFAMRMGARALVDKNAKKAFQLVGSSFSQFLSPEGTLHTIIRDMSESDAYQDAIENAGLISQNIDQLREIEYTTVTKTLKDGFSRDLTVDEQIALTTSILDTDLQAVYTEIDVVRAMTDEKYVEEHIEGISKELGEAVKLESAYNLIQAQTDGLAKFMLDGVGHIAQYQNAYKIAEVAMGTDEFDKRIVRIVDRLASMKAIRLLDVSTKETLASLYREERDGVDLFVAYAAAYNERAKKYTMSAESDKYKELKGYSRELYDKDVNTEVAPAADEADMKKRGFKLLKLVNKHPLDKNTVQMAVYVSTINAVQTLHRVAFRFEDEVARGTSITESYNIAKNEIGYALAKRDIAKMESRALDILDAQRKGLDGYTREDIGLTPVLDNAGRIKDFRYNSSKTSKIDELHMDRRGMNVLGRMYATLQGKDASVKYNEELIEKVLADARENGIHQNNLVGKNNNMEYIEISKYSTNSDAAEIWKILPEKLKRQYANMPIFVRRDMMPSIFGFRDGSLANTNVVKMMPVNIQYGVRVAEHIWRQVVTLAKTNIVIKIPIVLISNVISNFSYSVGTWMSPTTVLKLQLEGVRELNAFLDKTRERIRLSRLIEAGKGDEAIKRKVNALTNDLANNPVRDLIDAGFYSTIVEDMDLSEFKNKTQAEKFISNKLESFPKIVRTGLSYMFVTSDTPVFKALNMATQYSDFVARYAHYHLMVAKGTSKEEALKTVRDVYINYNKPNSKFIEWANQMGIVMFTKYFTRIQKAIKAEFKNHPIRTLLELATHNFVLNNAVPDIFEQGLLVKNYGGLVHGPIDSLVQAVSPSGLEALLAAYKKMT